MKKLQSRVLGFILLITVCSVARDAHGQDSTAYLPKDIIKVSLLHLLFSSRSLQVAYEHRFDNQFATQLDAGFLLPIGENRGFGDALDVRGFKLKQEIRYYYYSKNFGKRKQNRYDYYLGGETHQNILSYVEFDDRKRYQEYGYGFKVGFSEALPRISLDVNAGASVCYSRTEPIDLFSAIFDWNNNKKYFIRPILSFRIGYVID